MSGSQTRKPKRPHYVPRPPDKPFKYQCFQCPFTCNEKSHLFNHMKYDLCKDSIALVTGIHDSTARSAKTTTSTPAPRPMDKPPPGSPVLRRRGKKGQKEDVDSRGVETSSGSQLELQKVGAGKEVGLSLTELPSAFSRVPSRRDGTSPMQTPAESSSLSVLSPPFCHTTHIGGHSMELALPTFQCEDPTKDFPHSVKPGYSNALFPEHPLLIYGHPALPWDEVRPHILDHLRPKNPAPSPLLLTDQPYGYYLQQTSPHHFGLHRTPKQLPHLDQDSGHAHVEANSRHPWLVYRPTDCEGDAHSAPTWAAHWGMDGGEHGWPRGQDSGEGKGSGMSPKEAYSAVGSPDWPRSDSPLYSSQGGKGQRAANQSQDSTPQPKPIRWLFSSVRPQRDGTMLQTNRLPSGSTRHLISSSAEEEEDEEESPLNLTTKDRTKEEYIIGFHTSRRSPASQERTQQNTPLNLSIRQTLNKAPESAPHEPDQDTIEVRRRTAAFALCQLASSCSDCLNTTSPSICEETAASTQQSPEVKVQKRPGCREIHRPLQWHPKRPKTSEIPFQETSLLRIGGVRAP